MLHQDTAAVFPSREMLEKACCRQDEWIIRPVEQQKMAAHTPLHPEQAVADFTSARPFYHRPVMRNRRAGMRHPWLVTAVCLSTAALGYLAGVRQQENQLVVGPEPMPSGPSSVTMVKLKGGTFMMGDTLDGQADARPHRVSLSSYMMSRYEVSLELWDKVTQWGREHGYPDLPNGSGKAHNHPVTNISWGDAVKWCNALSEKTGRIPCYYTDTAKRSVARKGMVDIGNQQVDWEANGYRLPTEAEWEYAARGGMSGRRFPLDDHITQERANYHGSTTIAYDQCRRHGVHPSLSSSLPYTSFVGSFPANAFGLHDMAGNVAEWCWDFYETAFGGTAEVLNNPHGPDSGKKCVVRGGSWRHTASEARCASRFCLPGDQTTPYVGFRVVCQM